MGKKSKNKNRGPHKPAGSAFAGASQGRGSAGNAAAGVVDTDALGDGVNPPESSDATAAMLQQDVGLAADAFAPGADAAWSDDGVDVASAHSEGASPDALHDVAVEADVLDADTTAPDATSGDASADGDERPAQADVDAELAPAAPAAPRFNFEPLEIFDSGSGGGNPDDIRGVLIQLASARLLLPNATIAEVLSYAEPERIEGTPDWLLGRIRWRGWQLPLIAFSQLAGISAERGGLGSKVVVLKALAGGKTPYFAVLTQGFPRLVTVSRAALMVDEGATDLPDVILAHVTLNRDDAFVPDLERVETLIGEAMAQAA